ncbi:MAG TPA: hypothetical protein DCG47_00875 [Spirochaetaceae bacterium]|nr:hypothetical protein [Spirochaetaceae bacterium]
MLALSVVLIASCVSAKALPEDAPAEAVETPELNEYLLAPPGAVALILDLPLPLAPVASAMPALSATEPAAPDDIRAASPSGPESPALAGAMDEPLAPPKAAEAAPAVTPKAAPAPVSKAPTPSPAAKAPAVAPAPAAPSAPASSTPSTPPAASTPSPSSPAPSTAFSLPSAPTSSTRSVDAAVAPVAEIRVDAVRGERFELRFNGSGWTYLGDEDSKDGIRYETRRFEGNEAIFALRPEKSDDYLLRFQRQDPVSGDRQTSLVRVSVREPGTRSADNAGAASAQAQTQAPLQAAAPAVPVTPATTADMASSAASAATSAGSAAAAPASSAGSAGAAAGSGAAGSPPQSNDALLALSEPAALLAYARGELDAKRVRSSLDALDRYIELFKRGSDELFYLYGLAYEQDTPFRDIKLSYANYKRVRDEYPRSARWKTAAERVAYMERHYYGLK